MPAFPYDVRGQAATLNDYDLTGDGATRWRLHRRLREISGLASAPGDRIFAHDDERAVIYEIDREGRLVKAFAMGDKPVREDFAGKIGRASCRERV